MDWLWFHTEPDLPRWQRKPFSARVENGPGPHDKRDNHERAVGHEAPGDPEVDGIARRLGDAILRFEVFPPRLLSSVMSRRPVEIGDTVGLRYPFVPGLHLFFAARVINRFEETTDTHWRCGFTYRTLEGHPACGEETFIVEKNLGTGKVTVALRSWSRPGILIAKLTFPIMRLLQVRAAQAALNHLENMVRVSPRRVMRNLRTSLL